MRLSRATWIDTALALGLSVAVVVEGLVREQYLRGFAPVSLLTTLPLLFRRRWPIVVFAITILGGVLGGNSTGFAAFVAMLTAGVSMGIYATNRIVAIGVGLVCALAIALEFPGNGESSSLPIPGPVLPFFILGAIFLAGNEIRRQQQRAERLQREAEAAARSSAAAERSRIARDLHDVVAHSVSVMVVQAGAARQVLEQKPEVARQSLLAVEASGHDALTELRHLLGVLSDANAQAPLDPQPGLDALQALVERVKEAGLPVELHVEGTKPAMAPGVEVAAYRIVQEALTNALKYAGGARTEVHVTYTDAALTLAVLDEGQAEVAANPLGRGLVGMRERVALYGGSLEAGKRPGGGYAVRARLPLEGPPAAALPPLAISPPPQGEGRGGGAQALPPPGGEGRGGGG